MKETVDSIGKRVENLKDFVYKGTKNLELQEVERHILEELVKLGHDLLGVYVEKRGPGYVGKEILIEDGRKLSYQGERSRDYLSIFGEIEIKRAYYWAPGEEGYHPLDKEFNLPKDKYSYLFQEWGLQGCSKEAFAQAQEFLSQIFQIEAPKRSLQKKALEVSETVEGFYTESPIRKETAEGDVLVVALDGKGIPMGKSEGMDKSRLKRGEKRLKKKMAEVATIQTVVAEEVRKGRELGKEAIQSRNKMIYGELSNKERFPKFIRQECKKRGLAKKANKVFLSDGQPSLWGIQEKYFSDFKGILDWWHMSEHLWEAAYLFLPESSKRAKRWVKKKEKKLLEGKVDTVIRSLRGCKGKIRRLSKREELKKIIKYFSKNKEHMKYDSYIKEGLPIGSGSVEGACKHLIKMRMEGCGMRWKEAGAQAILKLRSVYLNKMWSDFWGYYRKKKQAVLYPKFKVISKNKSKNKAA